MVNGITVQAFLIQWIWILYLTILNIASASDISVPIEVIQVSVRWIQQWHCDQNFLLTINPEIPQTKEYPEYYFRFLNIRTDTWSHYKSNKACYICLHLLILEFGHNWKDQQNDSKHNVEHWESITKIWVPWEVCNYFIERMRQNYLCCKFTVLIRYTSMFTVIMQQCINYDCLGVTETLYFRLTFNTRKCDACPTLMPTIQIFGGLKKPTSFYLPRLTSYLVLLGEFLQPPSD